MTFHRIVDPISQLILTRWNLREPQADLPTVGPEGIDVMLCPGVAFDTAGHRLGKGKGFYDRYLATSQPSRPYLIGVTFASYLFSRIPHETHDKSMDLIITEEGMIAPK